MSPHIVIIDPAVKSPETLDFNKLVLSSPLPLTYHLPFFSGLSSLFENTTTIRGIIILGSLSSVHDREHWQISLANWLECRWVDRIPTLGLCFGHQLIAHIFGSRVEPAFFPQKKFRGWRQIQITKNRLWDTQSGFIFESHQECVLDIPSCMNLVATSTDIQVEGLEHKDLPIWTLQGHPEAHPSRLQKENEPLPHDLKFGDVLVKKFFEFCAQTS